MAVVTRPCGVFPCVKTSCYGSRASQHGWSIRSTFEFIKTQLCTIAVSLTLFNSVRLPREAFKYGPLPYLVAYSAWLVVIGLPTTLLQLAMGQLSQQDAIGIWRAVPILRGVGHLKIITSFVCCVYLMLYTALSFAYIIWIGKGSFPLRDCTRLQMTPQGYENKMNASECFNSTFLSSFTVYPQYLGIMAVLIFVLWFFLPICLYRLRKSLKVTLDVLTPIVIVIFIVLCVFLSNAKVLSTMFESIGDWTIMAEPYIWHSALVQALLSTQIANGYLTSAGSTIYRHSDVRWSATCLIITNFLAGWLWVMMWQSIGSEDTKDTSFVSILVLIYQSSASERRSKEWPLLAFGIVFATGFITLLTLLFPIFDKFQRLTAAHWRIIATFLSAIGTASTVALLTRGAVIAEVLDDLVVPVLAVFTVAVEVVGFVFIYGPCYLLSDIEFLTGKRICWLWIAIWSLVPILSLGVCGWWLRDVIHTTWGQPQTLWPLVAVLVGILVIVIIMAAVAVAKEEQFNFCTKMMSAFRPSRLWGPEEPMARYVWMSQRSVHESHNNEYDDAKNIYPKMIPETVSKKVFDEDWLFGANNYAYEGEYNIYNNNYSLKRDIDYTNSKPNSVNAQYSIPRNRSMKMVEEKFRSPNVCIANTELGGPMNCNCNRHFQLNVPDLRKSELTTSL